MMNIFLSPDLERWHIDFLLGRLLVFCISDGIPNFVPTRTCSGTVNLGLLDILGTHMVNPCSGDTDMAFNFGSIFSTTSICSLILDSCSHPKEISVMGYTISSPSTIRIYTMVASFSYKKQIRHFSQVQNYQFPKLESFINIQMYIWYNIYFFQLYDSGLTRKKKFCNIDIAIVRQSDIFVEHYSIIVLLS